MSVNDQDAVPHATPPNKKRRRLNGFATPASLTKPFKSPFRSTQQSAAPVPGLDRTENDTTTAGESSQASKASHVDQSKPSSPASRPLRRQLKQFRSNVSSPLSRYNHNSLPSEPVSQESSNAIAAAQRAQTTLIMQIAQTRQDIDALKQAVSLASSTKDTDLDDLIEKWTAAARAAAEEVFSTCKDKVNKMGGVGAWREREQQQKEWQKQWDEPLPDVQHGDDDSNDDEDGGGEEEGMDDMGKEEQRAIREMRRQLRAEKRAAMDYASEEAGGDGEQIRHALMEGNDDDTFTMGMMLKILNVDLNTIGFNKERQMWVG